MASRTYRERVIVARKTRLRDADLILTLLAEDGRQVRAVAKGAQKPASSFASRLELYAEAQVLLVEGRSLDIVKEARLLDGHAPLRFDFERSMHAAPIAELLALSTQDALPVERLFPMTQAVLTCLEKAEGPRIGLVMVSYLLKAASLLGFRPSLARCAVCGAPRVQGEAVVFSFADGGILCPDCAGPHPAQQLPAGVIDWASALLHSTFAQVAEFDIDPATLRALIQFAQSWVEAHLARLKSLPVLLATSPF